MSEKISLDSSDLVHYFNNFALHIDYDLKSMSFDYGTKGKGAWKIEQDLRLKISIGSSSIKGFTEGLNEARLSAIAICLYLAALKANPGKELHLMFLDDIFVILIVMCVVNQHITYPYIKNSSTNSNVVDY